MGGIVYAFGNPVPDEFLLTLEPDERNTEFIEGLLFWERLDYGDVI